MRTVLQVPMSKTLKTSAQIAARDLGFSSLQEAVRVLLKKLATRRITINVEEQVIPLSPQAEKRYAKMDKDFKSGKNIHTAKDINDLMKLLHES